MKKLQLLLLGMILFTLSGCSQFAPGFIPDPNITWTTFETNPKLTRQQKWDKLVSALITENFDMEIMDKESGYMRTTWRPEYINPFQIKRQVFVKLEGENAVRVKIVTHALNIYDNIWYIGRMAVGENEILEAIGGRIAK